MICRSDCGPRINRRSRGDAIQHFVRPLLNVRHVLMAQRETKQMNEHGNGAALFDYSKLYEHVPGGQLAVPTGL